MWKVGKEQGSVPCHIAIIMDGNGRWAQKRGLPRSAGHKQGAKAFREISKYCQKLGVAYLTVYAFSTENWKRPKEEVDSIMNLLRSYLKEVYDHQEENVCIRFLGDSTPLAEDLRQMMADIEGKGKNNTGITVNIAFNYGGRAEIAQAAKALAAKVVAGEMALADITEERLADALYTAGIPDPDLVIRPSGEQRVSNFLPWQSAYSEFVFMDILWPDFTPAHLDRALQEFSSRSRRFGGITT